MAILGRRRASDFFDNFCRAAGDNAHFFLIPLAALVASSARILRGISCGHDFDFHLVSWMETQRAWSQGVLYPHWAQSPNWGAGEPRFVFYPPLSWMLGALLGYLVNWYWVPALFVFLCLAGVGLTTRALARQFLPGRAATLAGVLATATPYALFTAYQRTAYAELTAAIGIPLLLLFALRQSKAFEESNRGGRFESSSFRRALDGSAVPLALVVAAIWLTNAPAGVMASYLLAFVALVAAVLDKSWWPVVRAGAGVVLGLGLAAFYLLPAAWEQRSVAIEQALDVGMRIRDSWLFARHGIPDLELHDHVLLVASTVLAFTVLAAGVGLGICLFWNKLSWEGRRFWMPMAVLIPLVLLLQFAISEPVWNLLPKLPFLQFPWRLLLLLGAPCTIFLAAATPLGSKRKRNWSMLAWALVLVLISVGSALAFFQNCDEEDGVENQMVVFQAGGGVEGTDEYAPVGSDNTLVASGLPDGCLVTDAGQELGESDSGNAPVWFAEQGSCDEVYTARVWGNEHKLLSIDSDHAGFVVMRLRRYPAWQVTVNGKAAFPQPVRRDDGLMVVPVGAGASEIDVRWMATPDSLWGRWISLGALGMLAVLWWIERRMRAIRLS